MSASPDATGPFATGHGAGGVQATGGAHSLSPPVTTVPPSGTVRHCGGAGSPAFSPPIRIVVGDSERTTRTPPGGTSSHAAARHAGTPTHGSVAATGVGGIMVRKNAPGAAP